MESNDELSREGWLIYRGNRVPHDGIRALPEPPPWRQFDPQKRCEDSARAYQIDPGDVETINVAIYLRRPLLVTGDAGAGKTSLADSIAYELGLGRTLKWYINSRSTLEEGLYSYDALSHFQAVSAIGPGGDTDVDVGQFVRLGPLGTALLPGEKPRVLLIDELDKSDLDLPSQLLTIFEEGQFQIPVLERFSSSDSSLEVMTADHGERAQIHGGRIICNAFPLVVMTSNGEREFPFSFVRRCISLDLKNSSSDKFSSIIAAHLGQDVLEKSRPLLEKYFGGLSRGDISTDQLLNVVYLLALGQQPPEEQVSALLLKRSDAAR